MIPSVVGGPSVPVGSSGATAGTDGSSGFTVSSPTRGTGGAGEGGTDEEDGPPVDTGESISGLAILSGL